MHRSKPLVFVTTNPHKLREANTYLNPLGISIEGVKVDLPEIQSVDIPSIVKGKAKAAYAVLKRPVLVEDSALRFEAWGALPGPLIKFFEQHMGLVGMVRALGPFQNTKAEACCTLGYYNGQTLEIFQGCVQGQIVLPRGRQGFGWDAIFAPLNQSGKGPAKTFAQMQASQKQHHSMRTLALAQFKKFLETHF